MPRIRSIHPDICNDDAVAALSPYAFRTWVLLWTHLDDKGRGVDNAKLWAGLLYPLNDKMTGERVEKDLAELEASNLLIRYEVAGKRYLSAKPESWAERQKPQKPTPSKLPPIPTTEPTTGAALRPLPHGGLVEGREDVDEGEGESEGEGSAATHLERALRALAMDDTTAAQLLCQAEELAHTLAAEEHERVLTSMRSRRGRRTA